MPTTMPGNGEEAAYVAFAITEELINLLVTRGLLDAPTIQQMFISVAERLSQESNFSGQRAARFVTDRMTGKE
jgi:hypothetical protein